MDLIIRLRDIGLLAINIIGNLGKHFFLETINEWLGIDPLGLGELTMFEFTCLSGVTVWLLIKIVQWIV